MNATLPLRSNRSDAFAVWRTPASGGLNRCSAVDQRHARLACGFDDCAERTPRDLLRIVVWPTLDHDADVDGQIAVVARGLQGTQVARIREIAFARYEELVRRATAA